jgi:hypothetical protein
MLENNATGDRSLSISSLSMDYVESKTAICQNFHPRRLRFPHKNSLIIFLLADLEIRY